MWIRASPESSSNAARDIFKSVFHDDISLWQTKYVALTKRACAESEYKIDDKIGYFVGIGWKIKSSFLYFQKTQQCYINSRKIANKTIKRVIKGKPDSYENNMTLCVIFVIKSRRILQVEFSSETKRFLQHHHSFFLYESKFRKSNISETWTEIQQ